MRTNYKVNSNKVTKKTKQARQQQEVRPARMSTNAEAAEHNK